MNIALWLNRAAREYGDQPALFWGKEQYGTYESLNKAVGQISTWLITLGINPGDRVAIFMLNCPDYLRLVFWIWFSGAVAVPINAKLHAKEAIWIIKNAELIDVSDGALLEAIKNLLPEPVLQRVNSDLAWLFYTSGTTGRPKGVMITHGMLKSMALSYFVSRTF